MQLLARSLERTRNSQNLSRAQTRETPCQATGARVQLERRGVKTETVAVVGKNHRNAPATNRTPQGVHAMFDAPDTTYILMLKCRMWVSKRDVLVHRRL